MVGGADQPVPRTDAAYQRWLTEVTDDLAAGTTGLSVFCRAPLPERNTTHDVGSWCAGHLMIGQEGAGAISSDATAPAARCFSADLGAPGAADLDVVAPAFQVWLRSGFAPALRVGPAMPLIADVYIDGISAGGVALLMRARTLLGADWRAADLSAAQPFLAARSAQPWRVRGTEIRP